MKKTEFILALVATLLGLAMLALPSGGTVVNILGAAVAALGTVGYTANRAGFKKVEASIGITGKPGYKTTEFYLSAVASLGGLIQPLLANASTAQQIAGAVLGVLGSMGYVTNRTEVKKAEVS
jgi:hypothetical protein